MRSPLIMPVVCIKDPPRIRSAIEYFAINMLKISMGNIPNYKFPPSECIRADIDSRVCCMRCEFSAELRQFNKSFPFAEETTSMKTYQSAITENYYFDIRTLTDIVARLFIYRHTST